MHELLSERKLLLSDEPLAVLDNTALRVEKPCQEPGLTEAASQGTPAMCRGRQPCCSQRFPTSGRSWCAALTARIATPGENGSIACRAQPLAQPGVHAHEVLNVDQCRCRNNEVSFTGSFAEKGIEYILSVPKGDLECMSRQGLLPNSSLVC